MIPDELINDSDMYVINPTDDQEERDCMIENNMYACLQLWGELESHFYSIDTNAKEFSNKLWFCMSG